MKMRRILAVLISAIMILTMIPVVTLTTSAAVEGDWTTYRSAGDYPSEDDEDDDSEEEVIYKPEAGYEYTSDGFTIVQPSYENTTPFVTAQTKDKQAIKDGIYLKIRIDDYSYDGGANADQWICFNLNSEQKVSPGSTKYGGGWLTLQRGTGNGSTTVIPHTVTPDTEEQAGTFIALTTGQGGVPVPMDDAGREIYTFEVTWDGSAYHMFINGTECVGSADATKVLEAIDSNGDFYVGVTVQSGVKGGTAGFTILEYGTSESEASTPVGDDSKEPETNELVYADIADPATVETNMPAILWTPETYNLKSGNNCTFTALGDNTWRLNATEAAVFFSLSTKRSWSYDAEDFPIFGILVRNFWLEGGSCYYAAGDVMTSQNDYMTSFSIYDGEFYGEDDEYIFIPVDLELLWEGRINSIRLDVAMDDVDTREFDICFAGMFRSVDEAFAYAESYLQTIGVLDPDATKAPDDTTAEPDETTAAPDETQADLPDAETTVSADTNASNGTADGGDTGDSESSGCGGVIGISSAAVLLTAAMAVVALKKKD